MTMLAFDANGEHFKNRDMLEAQAEEIFNRGDRESRHTGATLAIAAALYALAELLANLPRNFAEQAERDAREAPHS